MDAVTTAPPRRVDGSMSLLVDMMTNTLDEGYAERATHKAGAPASGTPPVLRRGAAARVLVAVGLVTGTAVSQVRERQEQTSGLRAELAAEVRERTAETEQLADQAERLRAEVVAAQDAALGADVAGRAAARRLEALALASGTIPVTGPGVVVRLSDAPEGQGNTDESLRGGTELSGRVQDRDLQDVVNGLWAAGAEAVSINDVRLTALTAIRSAGDAVLVDFRLLSPPYDVRAVGDPATLELELLDGPTGRRLNTYVLRYGLGFEVRRDRSLELPGASTPELRAALPAGGRS
jgi:uncharacterized protein YlxW (UPF0749 family)